MLCCISKMWLLLIYTAWQIDVQITRCVMHRGTVVAAPPPFRLGNPALYGSHPLVTPYYCRLGDFMGFCMCVCLLCFFLFFVYVFLSSFISLILLVGLLTCITVSQITCTVLVETLNPAHSLTHCCACVCFSVQMK